MVMPSEGLKDRTVAERLPYGLNLDMGTSGVTTFWKLRGIVDGASQLAVGLRGGGVGESTD